MLQQAMALHQAGRLPEAETLYRQFLLVEPDHPEALHCLGMLAHQAGKSEIGAGLIKKALHCRPDYVQAHNSLGVVLNSQGKLAEAAASYRRALALRPEYAQAHNNLGITLKEEGKLAEAAASFGLAINFLPDFAEAFYNLGITLKEQGRLDEAAASYRRTLALRPDHADAYTNLAHVLREKGELAEAAAAYRQALALQPDSVDAHCNLGNILKEQGRLAEAAASYRRVLALRPGHAEIHYNLGIILKGQGRLEEAIASHQRALALQPDFAEAHYNLGLISEELGLLEEAVASYRKALSLQPDYARAYKALASIIRFTEEDDVVRAMEGLYAQSISEPDRIELGFALGKIFEDLENAEKSFDFIREANRLKRSSFEYSIEKDRDLFERIKKTFSRGFFSCLPGLGWQAEAPIFILGMPRSGTTLVEQILASHPLVSGAGELKILPDLINAACQKKGGQFPEVMLALEQAELAAMGREYVERIRELAPDAKYITDKLPHNFLHVGLIKAILPRAKVVHCVRNPMDTCFSIFKKDFVKTHEYAYEIGELGEYYTLYRSLMAHWEEMLAGFLFTSTYEDLVLKQQDQIRALLAFCGLPWDKACLSFHQTNRRIRTASLVQVRQPLYRDSIERWQRFERQLEPLRKVIYG